MSRCRVTSFCFSFDLRLPMLLVLALVALSPAGGAQASTSVRVVETWPSSDDVMLGRNQNFYLRLAYDTDKPIGIWVTPYFQGKQVNVGSSPSPTYSGGGEALVWFFFMQPGEEVDEVRIKAGDGRTDSTPVVAVWRGHLVGGSEAVDPDVQPTWVTDMLAQDDAFRARMSQPMSAGDVGLLNGFMLGMFALGVAGFAAPVWGLWRWRGGWRLAAAVPAAMMAFVVLRLVFDVAREPTSHNLWPFEILMSGALSMAVMGALGAIRKYVARED